VKRIRYAVASSLDGYIAGPSGEPDWIPPDPDINFSNLWAQFDTLLIGRRTWDIAAGGFRKFGKQGSKLVIVSRSLQSADHPDASVLSSLTRESIESLRAEARKDIWLFGGGGLFRSLLELRLVDTVEVTIIPVLLGQGIPLLPATSRRTKLKLAQHRVYRSGRVWLQYDVQNE
jgi:dihydrofolate reductase